MTPLGAGVGLAALAAIVDWYAVGRADGHLERWAKPAVPLILIATALLVDPQAAQRSVLLVAALAASLAGDWLLLPPERFQMALVAFLVAHLAYLGAFIVLGLHLPPAVAGLVVAAVVAVAVGRRILRAVAGSELGRAVGAYLGIILLMAVAATATGSVPATAGAWVFVASDAILAWGRFVDPPGAPAAATRQRLAVIVSYHLAQLLLTVAILGAAAS